METEIELLKRSIITLQNCINSLHNRITELETPINRSNKHYFYSKDFETDNWLVKCVKTGGVFSTSLWRNQKIKNQSCPCCGETVERK